MTGRSVGTKVSTVAAAKLGLLVLRLSEAGFTTYIFEADKRHPSACGRGTVVAWLAPTDTDIVHIVQWDDYLSATASEGDEATAVMQALHKIFTSSEWLSYFGPSILVDAAPGSRLEGVEPMKFEEYQ